MSSRITRPTVASQQKVLPKKQYVMSGRANSNTKERKRIPATPKFTWRVNEELGYFELGTPAPQDDFYIFNTTLVSCEYFHLLEFEGRHREQTKPHEGYFWKVQYGAFGCDIASDSFQLSNENDKRHTFIGDKVTARIRSNGALFHEYLKRTSLEFRVFRGSGVNGAHKLAGISFVDLKDLTKLDIKGLKASLDIVPQGDFGVTNMNPGSQKPQLRVVIEMSVIPNFFTQEENIPMQIRASSNPSVDSKEREQNATDHDYETQSEEEVQDNNTDPPNTRSQHQYQDISVTKQPEGTTNTNSTNPKVQHGNSAILMDHPPKQKPITEIGSSSRLQEESNPKTAEGGDSVGMDDLDGVGSSRQKVPVDVVEDTTRRSNNLQEKVENSFAKLTNDEIIRQRDEWKEKERAYLLILQEEWSKRDEEREEKTSQMIQEQSTLKAKLETKQIQLGEMEANLRKREREVEEFANKATLGLTQRVEEMKLRMNFMKDKHQNDLDLAATKLESAHTEIDRLNGKIKSLEAKLRSKEDEVDQLNAMRTQWPDISLERKLVRLEEKNAALVEELARVRRERDSYRNGALSLAKRQNLLQYQRDTQLCSENDALRTKILMEQQLRQVRSDQESVFELVKNLDAIKKAYSKKGTETHEANLTDKIEKRIRSPPVPPARTRTKPNNPRPNINSVSGLADLNGNVYKKYLDPVQLAGMTALEIDSEITRLVSERDRMIGTGHCLRTDATIQNIDNALTRLASDLMVKEQITGY